MIMYLFDSLKQMWSEVFRFLVLALFLPASVSQSMFPVNAVHHAMPGGVSDVIDQPHLCISK